LPPEYLRQEIAEGVRLIVVRLPRCIFEALRAGIIETLVESGAAVISRMWAVCGCSPGILEMRSMPFHAEQEILRQDGKSGCIIYLSSLHCSLERSGGLLLIQECVQNGK